MKSYFATKNSMSNHAEVFVSLDSVGIYYSLVLLIGVLLNNTCQDLPRG